MFSRLDGKKKKLLDKKMKKKKEKKLGTKNSRYYQPSVTKKTK